MDPFSISRLGGLPEIPGRRSDDQPSSGTAFADSLASALREVDQLQRESEQAQGAYAEGHPVELHDVLIRVEQAEIAFKAMMEIRNKLINAYNEVVRMGGGG